MKLTNSQKKAIFEKKQNMRALQSLKSPSYNRNKTTLQRQTQGPGASQKSHPELDRLTWALHKLSTDQKEEKHPGALMSLAQFHAKNLLKTSF